MFIWLGIVTTGFTGLCLHVHEIINSYFEYKTVQYNYERDDGYHFPDVTICNPNGISSSNIRQAAKRYPEVKCILNKLKSKNDTKDCTLDKLPIKPDLFHGLGTKAYEIGHFFKDMVISCRFQKISCYKKDFILFQFSHHFNCYTFIKGRKKKISSQGIFSGLTLTLYIYGTFRS